MLAYLLSSTGTQVALPGSIFFAGELRVEVGDILRRYDFLLIGLGRVFVGFPEEFTCD